MFLMSLKTNYSIPRNLLEVYKTDEENFEPYVPLSGEESEEEESEEEEVEEEEETDEEINEEGFSLHQGEILETYYYNNLLETDNEHDYEDINNNGSLTLTSVDKKRFYKGVRLLLRKGWENYGEPINPLELPELLLGFITEQTYTESGVELKISGMTKLLEKEYQFSFTQMKMSEILAEMIKTAGMEPVINVEGLDDRVIDYTNVSSDDDGGSASGDGSMTEDEVWAFASTWGYGGSCSSHDPEEAWNMLSEGDSPDCYGATAWLYYALNFKAGVTARDICYASSSASSGSHHTVQVKKNGKWIDPPQYSNMHKYLGVISGHATHVSRHPPNNKVIPPYIRCPYSNNG